MRAYTLSLLAKLSPDGSPIVESEIVSWANERLSDKGVSIRHFKVNFSILLTRCITLSGQITRQQYR